MKGPESDHWTPSRQETTHEHTYVVTVMGKMEYKVKHWKLATIELLWGIAW